MARTFKRQPYSVSIKTKDHPVVNSFVQTNFAGVKDSKNDITIEQTSFVDAQNVYVNEDNILVSRPPFKFVGDNRYVLQAWTFGTYHLVFTRHFLIKKNDEWVDVDSISDITSTISDMSVPQLKIVYEISCISHNVDNTFKKEITNDARDLQQLNIYYTDIPKVFCMPKEDKIFIWYNGTDFWALNTSTLHFEDARKHIYEPIRSLVINGIESDFETRNFLTESYRKRYQRSSFSSMATTALLDATGDIDVYMSNSNTQNKSTYLYSTSATKTSLSSSKKPIDKSIIYPYCDIGKDYSVSVVETDSGIVVLRYKKSYGAIEVSFDGTYFRALPALEDIIGDPLLTEDGLYAVAFTREYLCKCKLVASETSDLVDSSEIMTWTRDSYFRKGREVSHPNKLLDKFVLEPDSKPTAKFVTIDLFTYIVSAAKEGSTTYQTKIYSEWLGFEGVTHACYSDTEANGYTYGKTGDVKIDFRIPAITTTSADAGPVMALLYDTTFTATEDGKGLIHKSGTPEHAQMALINGIQSMPWAVERSGEKPGLCYINGSLKILVKLTKDLMFIDQSYIRDGDRVALMDVTEASAGYKYGKPQYQNTSKGEVFLPGIKADLVCPSYGGGSCSAPRYIIRITGSTSTGAIIGANTVFDLYPLNEKTNYKADDYFTLFGAPTSNEPGTTTSYAQYAPNWDNVTFNNTKIPAQPYIGEAVQGFFVGEDAAYSVNYRDISAIKLSDRDKYKMDIKITSCVASDTIDRLDVDGYIAGRFALSTNDGIKTQDTLIKFHADTSENGHSYDLGGLTTTVEKIIASGASHYVLPNDYDGLVLTNRNILDLSGDVIYYEALPKNNLVPVKLDSNGVWLYDGDGTLWTSALSNVVLEIDVHHDKDDQYPRIVNAVPEHFAELSEQYFSFTKDGTNYLEITSNKHSEYTTPQNNERDLLLYLPEYNEEIMPHHITALHPLTNTAIGAFTEEAIWSISTTTLSDGSIAYTRPLKSKIPFGLREGDEVITAFDGSAIIFPARRGIAVLSPEDLSTTEDKTISYMTDAIDERYRDFYDNPVKNTSFMPYETSKFFDPAIHITKYLYWIVFYKYMSNEILLYDTRNVSWWRWTTPYPIMSIDANDRLHLLLRVDYSPINKNVIYTAYNNIPSKPFYRASLLGVPFVLADREMQNLVDNSGNFPLLDTSNMNDMKYYDDIIPDTINGIPNEIVQSAIGPRRTITYANRKINWFLVSQKLHFGLINNYKFINGINMSLKGMAPLLAKVYTKCFRDYYHPESYSTDEIKINELRTFVRRLNLMHVINFQYKLENNGDIDEAHQLQLNEITIKYEGKERIR